MNLHNLFIFLLNDVFGKPVQSHSYVFIYLYNLHHCPQTGLGVERHAYFCFLKNLYFPFSDVFGCHVLCVLCQSFSGQLHEKLHHTDWETLWHSQLADWIHWWKFWNWWELKLHMLGLNVAEYYKQIPTKHTLMLIHNYFGKLVANMYEFVWIHLKVFVVFVVLLLPIGLGVGIGVDLHAYVFLKICFSWKYCT